MTDAPPSTAPRQDPGPPRDDSRRPPLRRSRDQKMIAGVCGGLGRCFDLDPVIFRVVLGVLGVTGGLGLIAYGFAWLLVPLEGEEENEGRRLLSGRVEGPALTAVLCALVGCGLFLSMLNNSGVMAFSLMLLIATGGAAYWSRHRRLVEAEAALGDAGGPAAYEARGAAPAAPPETQAPPAPGGPSWWRDPLVKGPAAPVGRATSTGYLWGPDDGPYDRKRAAAERARPVRTGRRLGGWTFLLALLAFGLGMGLTWHHRPLGGSLETGLACALGVFGLGIAVSSVYGRTGGGTVVAAVLTGALLTGAAALPDSVSDDWVRMTWRPASPSEVRDRYELGSGVGVLDLSGLRWTAGRPVTVATTAEAGAGRIKVVLPEDVTARLTIEVGLGDIRLPGEARDDIDVQPGQHRTVTLEPTAGHTARGTLDLRLKAGLGQVEVTRGTP
ncbi:PspC domain-containing protein [Streptomyces sp. NPDC049577]|uniref:PspC domain-containing protein n=1 Tax=Streptomyces sp. NPDC049577 TaxID=3155153 RepID=UPI003431D47A